jgi:outer membrane protein assembly factor BamB
MGDELIATDPKNGSRQWARKLKGDLARQGGFLGAPPVAAGEWLFSTTLAGEVTQLDPKSGEARKTWELGHPTRFPAIVDGGRIFVGTEDGRLVCIDTGDAKNTGWPQWGANAQRTGVYAGK